MNRSTEHRSPHWRLGKPSDLPAINRIADAIHDVLPERPAVLAEKTELFPEGCMLFDDDGIAVGYGISHPWILDSVSSLDSFLQELPCCPNCIYVHDVVVLPSARGHNATGTYLKLITEIARKNRIDYLALVSVYNSDPLWASQGFRTVFLDEKLNSKLRGYGNTAKYMILELKQ